MKKILMLLAVCSLVGFLSSCEKEQMQEPTSVKDVLTEAAPETLYKFNKDITITSAEGTEGIMRVYSDDQAGLAEYSSRNFRLIELKAGESTQEALIRLELMDTSEGQEAEDTSEEMLNDQQNTKSPFAFQLMTTAKDKRLAVSFFHPKTNGYRSWEYFTHYSQNPAVNSDLIVQITRNSFWRRVYYGVRYKQNPSPNTWLTVQGEWTKIKNNQTAVEEQLGCYQLRARVRTKKESAYSITFVY